MSKQLKVVKKHESWFLFAGSPVKFGLKEFALVTGLNCHNLPRSSKKRSNKEITEKPYWVELFGTKTDVPVSYVVNMLKKKKVSDPDKRIKYALLALLSSVLLPTSHTPRISHEHAEMIKDLDNFLSYPWGRVSFEMLMSSIKERNEVSLSQNTIACKGFVMALQLVLIEFVHALTGVVRDGGSSGSEAESEDDDSEGTRSINTVRVREIEIACKAKVNSIIYVGADLSNVDPEDEWSDDEDDVLVENLVRAINDGFIFSNSHFKGGASKADVIRMREEAKKDSNKRKTVRRSQKQSSGEPMDAEYVASIVRDCIAAEMSKFGDQIKELSSAFDKSQILLRDNMEDLLVNFHSDIVDMVANQMRCTYEPPPGTKANSQAGNSSNPIGTNTLNDLDTIIGDAIRFADISSTPNEEVPTPVAVVNSGPANKDDLAPKEMGAVVDDQDPIDEAGDGVASQPSQQQCNQSADATALNVVKTTMEQVSANNLDIIPLSTNSTPGNEHNQDVATGLSFPDPSFSIGLTQINQVDPQSADKAALKTNEVASPTIDEEEVPIANRKSKRAKIVPRNLVGEYQCDKRFITRAWEAFKNAICSDPNVDYARKLDKLIDKLALSFVMDFGSLTIDSTEFAGLIDKSSHLSAKVVDVLIYHTRSIFTAKSEQIQAKNCCFLDTKFVSLLAKSYPKFSKATKKETYRFPAALSEFLSADFPISEATRFYFPFNFDQQHWVSVCVDTSTWQATVLDCNTARKMDSMISKDFRPISQMFPYLIRQAGKQLTAKDLKPLSIERPRSVPQNTIQVETAITSVLLCQAHAVGGVEVCKCITPEALDVEIQRVAVMIYEENIGPL